MKISFIFRQDSQSPQNNPTISTSTGIKDLFYKHKYDFYLINLHREQVLR